MLVLLVAGELVRCMSAEALRTQCKDKLVMGHWQEGNTSQSNALTWEAFDRGCNLQDGIAGIIKHNLSIVIFGDSVDRYQVVDVCRLASRRGLDTKYEAKFFSATVEPKHEAFSREAQRGYDHFHTCCLPQGIIHFTFITGLDIGLPQHHHKRHTQRSVYDRVQAGLDDFQAAWGRSPDITVVSSNLWDAVRMEHSRYGLTNTTLTDAWGTSLSRVMQQVQATFPSSHVKVLHTTSQVLAHNGWLSQGLQNAVIKDLNAAAKNVAYDLHWQVADLACLTNEYAGENLSAFLRDDLHPKPFVLHTLLDIYVTLFAASGAQASI